METHLTGQEHMDISSITNKIALVSVIALIYWVFVFICVQVFGLKVFGENLAQIFGLSIVGLCTVLAGTICVNIMHNLTIIARCHDGGQAHRQVRVNTRTLLLFAFSLPVIAALLFVGDMASSQRKQARLAEAANILAQEQAHIIDRIADYRFSRDYLKQTSADIKLMSKVDENFPEVTAIVRDTIEGKPMLLAFGDYFYETKEPAYKVDYILSTSAEERAYLNEIFDGVRTDYLFSAHDGRYEIYYPVKTDNGTIVFHLSEYSRYGKIGS
jgi:hypothetical protein